MCKILILVLSNTDNNGVYDKFYKSQMETWNSLECEGVKVFHYYGSSNENKIEDFKIFTKINDELYFDQNGYINSPLNAGYKTIEAFRLIKDFEYDFLFRTTLSSYVDKQRLKIFCQNLNKNRYYGGITGVETTSLFGELNGFNIQYVTGSCIIMSKDIVNMLIDNEYEIDHKNYLDDAAFGKFLNIKGIIPENIGGFASLDDMSHFHYKLKTMPSGSHVNRDNDINNMYLIHENKNKI